MISLRAPILSVPDSFALALAKERAWTLLTGDGDLRDLATGENVDCHGVLWLLDRMERGWLSTSFGPPISGSRVTRPVDDEASG